MHTYNYVDKTYCTHLVFLCVFFFLVYNIIAWFPFSFSSFQTLPCSVVNPGMLRVGEIISPGKRTQTGYRIPNGQP